MILVEFIGAPGSGKSTAAAELYSMLSKAAISTGLITEFIKDFANRGYNIETEDQLWILGSQARAESQVYNKYPVVVCDTSLYLCAFYNKFLSNGLIDHTETVKTHLDYVDNKYDINRVRYIRHLDKNRYSDIGRYQNFEESTEIEGKIFEYFNENSIQLCKTQSMELIFRNIVKELEDE